MQQILFNGHARRTLFKHARELLKDKPGVKYELQYPAKLRVSHNGKEFYFTDPDKTVKFAESNFEISGPV